MRLITSCASLEVRSKALGIGFMGIGSGNAIRVGAVRTVKL